MNKYCCVSSFQIWMRFFFSRLIALASTSSTEFSVSGGTRHSGCISDLRRNASLFHRHARCQVKGSHRGSFRSRNCPSLPSVWRFYVYIYRNGYRIFWVLLFTVSWGNVITTAPHPHTPTTTSAVFSSPSNYEDVVIPAGCLLWPMSYLNACYFVSKYLEDFPDISCY